LHLENPISTHSAPPPPPCHTIVAGHRRQRAAGTQKKIEFHIFIASGNKERAVKLVQPSAMAV
jgi:hypothetical protein